MPSAASTYDITEMEAKALNWEVPSNSMLIVNHVDPGLNHFDGYTALQYARLRKIDNDWKRVERQRTVIKAVLDPGAERQRHGAGQPAQHHSAADPDELYQVRDRRPARAAAGLLGCDVQQMSMPLQGTYGIRTGMDDRLMYDPDWVVNIKALQDFCTTIRPPRKSLPPRRRPPPPRLRASWSLPPARAPT